MTLRHSLLCAFGLLAAAAAAPAGEVQRLGFSGDWRQAQEIAAKAEIVVAARVVKADVPTGKGWDGQYGGGRATHERCCSVDVQQLIEVEVSEALRGKVRERRFVTTVGVLSVEYTAVQPFLMGLIRAKRVNRGRIGLPPAHFALEQDRDYLLFLERAEGGGTEGAGEDRPEKLILYKRCAPMLIEGQGLLNSVRRFCREIEAWERPAPLGPDEDRAVRNLIAGLGADDYERREKAESALRTMGAKVRTYLEKASADADEERAFRARRLLRRAKPEPGKVEFPGHEAARRGPAVFKERPKPKPEPEPGAEGGPEPGAEPPPGPEGADGGGDPGGGG